MHCAGTSPLRRVRPSGPEITARRLIHEPPLARPAVRQGSKQTAEGFACVLMVPYGAEFLSRYLLRLKAGPERLGQGVAVFIHVAPLVVFAIAAIAAFVLSGWPTNWRRPWRRC